MLKKDILKKSIILLFSFILVMSFFTGQTFVVRADGNPPYENGDNIPIEDQFEPSVLDGLNDDSLTSVTYDNDIFSEDLNVIFDDAKDENSLTDEDEINSINKEEITSTNGEENIFTDEVYSSSLTSADDDVLDKDGLQEHIDELSDEKTVDDLQEDISNPDDVNFDKEHEIDVTARSNDESEYDPSEPDTDNSNDHDVISDELEDETLISNKLDDIKVKTQSSSDIEPVQTSDVLRASIKAPSKFSTWT